MKLIKRNIGIMLLMLSCMAGLFLSLVIYWRCDVNQVYKSTKTYEYILGKNGKFKTNYLGYNDVFPNQLPTSAKIEKFHYEYVKHKKPSYLGYLVYHCNKKDFMAEYQRLKTVDSTKLQKVYGIKDYPYELLAVKADETYGVIYALADAAGSRFIYVEMQFYNHFMALNYKKVVDQKYLPNGFDATIHNKIKRVSGS